jgi:hypothetical protein
MLNSTCEVARTAHNGAVVDTRHSDKRETKGIRYRSLANYFRNKTSKANARMCRQLDLEERDNQTALLAQGE